jgi:hydroxymethylglutaryl-CoA lyase
MEKAFMPTESKIAYIDALSACGFARIEVTSYTSPKAIPTLADADAVMAGIRRVPGARYSALVPDLRGMERAVEGRPDEINLMMSVSETHNRANLRMTREPELLHAPLPASASPWKSATASRWWRRCARTAPISASSPSAPGPKA